MAAPPGMYAANARNEYDDGEAEYDGLDNLQAAAPAPSSFGYGTRPQEHLEDDDGDVSDEPKPSKRRTKRSADSDDDFKPSDEEDDDDIESDAEEGQQRRPTRRSAAPTHQQMPPRQPAGPRPVIPGSVPGLPPGAHPVAPGAYPVAPGAYYVGPPPVETKPEFDLSFWEDGVRRSSRSRKQVSKPHVDDEDDSEVDDDAQVTRRVSQPRAASRAAAKSYKDDAGSDPEWDDDFEDDEEGGPRRKRGGRLAMRRGAGTPILRVATRSGPRKKYDETEGDDQFDEDVKEGEEASLDPAAAGYAEGEPEDDGHTVDKVVRHREVVAAPPLQAQAQAQGARASPATVREYWIKWKGRSYIYNTWNREEELVSVKGYKKVQNYIQKQEQIELFKKTHGQDEVEEQAIENELDTELQSQHVNIERVVESRQAPDGLMEYLIKWEGLPYSECTWEPEPDALRNSELRLDEAWFESFAAGIREMREREVRALQPSNDAFRNKKWRAGSAFQKMAVQPAFLKGGDLRDYQLEGLNWMAYSWNQDRNVILADEMGLGKTLQTISYISYVHFTANCRGPFVVVVPLSTLAAWMKEFRKWVPELNVVVYIGDQKSREMIRNHEWPLPDRRRTNQCKFDVLLTTYEIVNKDADFLRPLKWALLVVDEAHRLKSDKSALYQTLTSFDAANKLLVTGTPIQNEMRELWCLLHFLDPARYATSADFETRYADVRTNTETVKRLHEELQYYILRRLKSDVEKSLPPKMERILRVDMAKQQREFYTMILNKNWKELFKGAKNQHGCLINIIVELKKCCNHPYLVAPPEQVSNDSGADWLGALIRSSGKMILLDKLLKRLKETGHRVLIFSQMVKMLNILSDYLMARGYKFQRLDGTMRGDVRQQCMEHFNAPGSDDFCFLLSTRAGGLGINLATADTVIIYDSDWNPQNDLQAEARAHRIGQKNVVNIYRFVTSTSVEEDILERAKRKLVLDHVVIQQMDTSGRTVLGKKPDKIFNKDELAQALRFGAEKLFDKEAANDATEDLDLDAILARADQTAGSDARPEQRSVDGLLSAFKVANFNIHQTQEEEKPKEDDSAFWSRFISEEERKRWEQDPAAQAEAIEFDEKGRPMRRSRADAVGGAALEPPLERGRPGSKDGRAGGARRRGRGTGIGEKERKMFKRWLLKLGTRRAREIREKCASLSHLSDHEIHEMEKEFVALCEDSIRSFKEAKAQGKPLPGLPGDKDGAVMKRPMFVYGEEKVDAEEALRTIRRLEVLQLVVNEWRARENGNIQRFRAAPHMEPSRWPDWTVREDNAVLLGCYRHGIGSWQLIREDGSLSLSHVLPTDMKQGAAPGADGEKGGGLTGNKLMTRVNRMLDTLSKMRAQESHGAGAASSSAGGTGVPRKRQRPPQRGPPDGESPRPAPKRARGGAKAAAGEEAYEEAPRRAPKQRRAEQAAGPDGGAGPAPSSSAAAASAGGAGGGEEEEDPLATRARRWLLDTSKEALKRLREVVESGDKSKEASQKLAKYLRTIGKAIDELLADAKKEHAAVGRLETVAWSFVASRYANNRMDGSRLRDTYVKIRQNAASQQGAAQAKAAGPPAPAAASGAAGGGPVPGAVPRVKVESAGRPDTSPAAQPVVRPPPSVPPSIKQEGPPPVTRPAATIPTVPARPAPAP